MGSTLVFWLFLTFLFGAGMLVLLLGYRGIEEQRARDEQRQAEQLQAARDKAAPRFFVVQPATELPSTGPVLNDALLASLESYVRSEQALAAQFVDEPSIDSLYRQSAPSNFVQ